MRAFALAASAILFSSFADAQVFKCVEERTGKISFSDVPCHGKDSGRVVDASPNTVDSSGSREQALRREVMELRDRMNRYESASQASSTASSEQSSRIDTRACEQARRSYDIEAGSMTSNKATVEAKRSAMYGACGMQEPTRIEITNKYYGPTIRR